MHDRNMMTASKDSKNALWIVKKPPNGSHQNCRKNDREEIQGLSQ